MTIWIVIWVLFFLVHILHICVVLSIVINWRKIFLLVLFIHSSNPINLPVDPIDLCLVPLHLSLVLHGLWDVEDLHALPDLLVHLLW